MTQNAYFPLFKGESRYSAVRVHVAPSGPDNGAFTISVSHGLKGCRTETWVGVLPLAAGCRNEAAQGFDSSRVITVTGTNSSSHSTGVSGHACDTLCAQHSEYSSALMLRKVRLSLTCQSQYPRDTRVLMLLNIVLNRAVLHTLSAHCLLVISAMAVMCTVDHTACPIVCNRVSCPITPANPVPASAA